MVMNITVKDNNDEIEPQDNPPDRIAIDPN
jgi:hypothetical protein